MMNRMKKVILATLLSAVASSSLIAEAQAQTRPEARGDGERDYSQQFVQIVDKVQSNAEILQMMVDSFPDDSRRDGSDAEDPINEGFERLRDAADRLEQRVDDNGLPAGETRELNESWREIENLIRGNPNVAKNVELELEAMRTSMTQLLEFASNR